MKKLTIKSVTDESIIFNDGSYLQSSHEQDCCEHHYLDFSNEDVKSLKELEFPVDENDHLDASCISEIEDYGIEIKPLNNHPLRIPGYGYNNGYYSSNLLLEYRSKKHELLFSLDVSDCQIIDDGY